MIKANKFTRNPRRLILYISYDGVLEPLGQSQIVAYLEKLSNANEISLISFEKPSDLEVYIDYTKMRTRLHSAGITWTALKYHKTPSVISTALDLVIGIVFALYVSSKRRPQIVHARSYIPALISLIIKPLTGARLVFDMRGFWADERIDGALWPNGGILYKLTKWFEKRFFLASDHLVTLTNASLGPISAIDSGRQRRLPISVIPTCVDLDRFTPLQIKRRGERFTLGYVGSVGTWYLLDEMLTVFKVLQGRRRDAKLLFVNRSEHADVEAAAAVVGIDLSRIEIISAAFSDIPSLISRMDAGLMLIKPCFSKIASAPTKLAEYLACGVPCFGNVGVGDVEYILELNRVGVALRSFDQSAIDAAVERMLLLVDDPQISLRCRATAEKFFSLDDGAKKYAQIYESLAPKFVN